MEKNNSALIVFLLITLLLSACASNSETNNNSSQENGFTFDGNEIGENEEEDEEYDFDENEVNRENNGEGFEFSEEESGSVGEEQNPTLEEFSGNDACLQGDWIADNAAFAEYLSKKMNSTDLGEFVFYTFDGELRMTFEGTNVEMKTDAPLTTTLDVNANGLTIATLYVEVTASGTGSWGTYENKLVIYGQEYNSEGQGDAIGILANQGSSQNVSLDFSLGDFILTSDSVDLTPIINMLPPGEPYGVATYICTENTMTMSTDDGATAVYFLRE
jgi:hypothetical protein